MKKILRPLAIVGGAVLLAWLIGRGLFYVHFYFDSGWSSPKDQGGEIVVLVHGLRASGGSMDPLAHFLDEKGYTVINLDYPSSAETVETLAETHLAPLLATCCQDPERPVHVVTHSMGGIVLRQVLQTTALRGKAVMIAPPNQGSPYADFFSHWWIARKIMGPGLEQLRTGDEGILSTLDPVVGTVGVIAGTRDGKAPTDLAKLDEMTDFLTVDEAHVSILSSPEVFEAVETFLTVGRFQ